MRLLKLKLQNWRAVEAREIEFSPGVTLIEGPNEIGKSTIIEAIQSLFTVMDSSSKADIKAIQPVGRDVGSTVEVEAEIGDYRFIYAKTYNRNKQTELRVLAPHKQQYTGREAHERVEQMLEESVDMALWNALLVEQGSEIAGVSLAQSDGLARALDEAAGGGSPEEDHSDLYVRVQAEYELYFSVKTGNVKAWQGALDSQLSEARLAEAAAASAMQEIELDIANHERTKGEIARLEAALPGLQQDMRENEANWLAIGKIKEQLLRQENEFGVAEELLRATEEERSRRHRLIEGLAESRAKHQSASEALLPQAAELKSLEAATQSAKTALDNARAELKAAQQLAQLSRNDVDHLQAAAQLVAISTRLGSVREFIASRNALREALQGVRMNPDALNALRDAEREVEMARARLDTATSSIEIKAEDDLSLVINDETLAMSRGSTVRRDVASATRLVLPGIASFQVTPSQSANELETELLERRDTLVKLLADCQVSDLPEAVAVEERRAEQEREVRIWHEKIEDLLDGETLETLQILSEELSARVRSYLTGRMADTDLPGTPEDAKQIAAAAADALSRCQTAMDTLQIAWEQARDAFTEARGHYRVAEQQAEGEARIAQQRQQELEEVRAAEDDESIDRRVREKTAAVDSLRAGLMQLKEQLASASPDAAEQLFENAQAVCQRAQQQLADNRTDLAVLSDRLAQARADGRYEALELATSNRLAIEEELAAMSSRAAAAQRLWQVLNRHRDETRSAYVQPLKEGVEQFGRIVFGADFEIELGENWELRSRTLHGRTIPFDDLSIGAKEQLGILLRLAAARIVSKQGGVPLIIDDALGFSDPDRLKTMAAAIASAGKDCQVIVLTCSPGRFTHVGNAQVVNL
jgi:DNA repair exonuclease SbcCD ATPase subunit